MTKSLGRTGTLIVWLSLVMLIALLICAQLRDGGAALFVAACTFLGGLGGFQATKSTLEAGMTGVGLKRVRDSIMGTETPPAPPAVP